MVKNYHTIKTDDNGLAFLKKIVANRFLLTGQEITIPQALTLIEKYNKNNNIAYKEMVSQEIPIK